MTNPIPLHKYCPRTKYGLTVQEIIQHVVQVEDELNERIVRKELPKYDGPKMEWTLASIEAFGKDVFRMLIP